MIQAMKKLGLVNGRSSVILGIKAFAFVKNMFKSIVLKTLNQKLE